jgi:hypothetical protein
MKKQRKKEAAMEEGRKEGSARGKDMGMNREWRRWGSCVGGREWRGGEGGWLRG